jgi:hypothetical protein
LVLTERYRLLLAGLAGTMTSTERPVQRVLNGLVSLELDERVADFAAMPRFRARKRSHMIKPSLTQREKERWRL